MRALLSFAEKAFTVLVLLLLSEGLYPHLRQGSGFQLEAAEGDPVMQIIWMGIYAITLPLVFVRWRQFISVATREKLILFLVGIAIASVLWSDVPNITLRRTVALLGTTLFGTYLGIRYSLLQQLRLLAWMIGIAALLSVLYALALPIYGTMSGFHQGAWRGIYGQKNILGRLMTLGAVVFSLIPPSRYRNHWVTQAGFGLSVSLILLSQSKTALVIFLTVLALLPLYRVLRWKYTLAVPILIFVVLGVGSVSTLLLANVETVLTAFGRDITLSGRTTMWSAVLTMILERPWLGYGYSGFWLGWQGDGSTYVWNAAGWEPKFAHNGYLDLGLYLGFLGLLIFTLGFLMNSLRAITWLRSTKTAEGLWPLIYLTFMLLYNFTESAILKQNSIFWVLYVSTTFSLFIQHNLLSKNKLQKHREKQSANLVYMVRQ